MDRPQPDAVLLQRIAEATADFRGRKYFSALVVCLTGYLHQRFAFITITADEHQRRGVTVAFADRENLREPRVYDLAGLPCMTVLGGTSVTVPCNLPELHPGATGVASYCGVPLRGRDGAVLGLLAIEDEQALTPGHAQATTRLLRQLAGRVAAELECELLTLGREALLQPETKRPSTS
ncbi:GAF domain-containing protein [Inhella gelatinilytica]|uniref:GAF domain-containing protein n=1 Tax=Inhella gelatinilytica TaxID=2795030 RepID=A0A931IVP8_9BURK|nr:GAF domain-containing protein [Inhella gelatinilytica]MBH9553690.1 GAF domain-containing protein [Inhella gelatinilytica]